MSEVKWIKIVTDVFDNEKIKFIETLPEGDTIIVIWFKLLCLAGRSNDCGAIMLTENIPYTDDMLVSYIGRKETTVKFAMETFERLGMIERYDSKTLIANWSKYQNVKGIEEIKEKDRQRKANQRARQKGLPEPYPKEEQEENNKQEDVSQDSPVTVTQNCSISSSNSLSNNNCNKSTKSKKKSKYEECLEINMNIYKNHINDYSFSEELKKNITEWLDYKSEKHKDSYTDGGMIRLLSEMRNNVAEHGEPAVITVIGKAIMMNWKGIYYDSIKDVVPSAHEEKFESYRSDRE